MIELPNREAWNRINALEADRVRALCQDIGYGRVMQLAELVWRADKPSGFAGAEHSVGPCASTLVPCPCSEDRHENGGASCEWCCGSCRVTKRVRSAMLQVAAAKALDEAWHRAPKNASLHEMRGLFSKLRAALGEEPLP